MSSSPLSGILFSLPEIFSDFLAACSSPPPLRSASTMRDAPEHAPRIPENVPDNVPSVVLTSAAGGSQRKEVKKRKRHSTRSSQVEENERRRLLGSVPNKAPRPFRRASRVCGTPLSTGWCTKGLGHLGNCSC